MNSRPRAHDCNGSVDATVAAHRRPPVVSGRRALLVKLVAGALLLGCAAVLVALGTDLRGLLQRALETVQQAGPLAFFGAMAVLPAAGAPLSPFALTAGSIFGAQMGMPLVVACALAAVTTNVLFTYWLARNALRPLLEKLVARLGYRLPEADKSDASGLIVLVRATPGVPFPVQNYLLGLARVPFGKYMLISCVTTWGFNAAFVIFGEALIHGRGKVAMLGFGVLIALVAGTHLVRKHYERRKRLT